jgi:hypothetical protein
MTDDEIIALAKRLGWNVEHAQTNRMLVLFTRAVAVELVGQQNKALIDSALLSSEQDGLKTRGQDMTLREAAQQALEAAEEALPKMDERETVWCSIKGHHLRVLHDALRAALQTPPPPPEAQTDDEKNAYHYGWWAAMEAVREQRTEPEQADTALLRQALEALQTILNISLMDTGHWAKTVEAEAGAAITALRKRLGESN